MNLWQNKLLIWKQSRISDPLQLLTRSKSSPIAKPDINSMRKFKSHMKVCVEQLVASECLPNNNLMPDNIYHYVFIIFAHPEHMDFIENLM